MHAYILEAVEFNSCGVREMQLPEKYKQASEVPDEGAS